MGLPKLSRKQIERIEAKARKNIEEKRRILMSEIEHVKRLVSIAEEALVDV